jgi:hypothetical protein
MRLDHPIRELASGVDALYLSARADLPAPFLAHLEYCREWAVEVKRRAPCEIGNAIFGISPFVAIEFNLGKANLSAVHKVVLAAVYAIVLAGVVYLASRSKRQGSDSNTLPPLL